MSQQMIEKIITDLTHDLEGDVLEVISKMQGWFTKYPEYSTLKIIEDYDGERYRLYLVGERPENPEEVTLRLRKDELVAAREEARDRRQYEFLKKKFG